MKIVCNLVGLVDHHRTLEWPEGWPVPREGDGIELNGVPGMLAVRTVAWYPEGDHESKSPEPFVYVVIGRPRSTFY